jgi:hypothetical protein
MRPQPRFVFPLLFLATAALARPLHAADPTTADCLSASEASLKLRGEHKLREARGQLLVCASASCPADVRNECVRRVDPVNAAIPTIIFEAKDAAGNDMTAVKVTMDGQPLADRLEGSAISLDPGTHTFRFEVAGQPPMEKILVIYEAVKDRHEPIVIGTGRAVSLVPTPTPTPTPAPAPAPIVVPLPSVGAPLSPPPTPASAPDTGASTSTRNSRKTVALAVGGLGIAGLAVGGIFGGVAASDWSSAKSESCSTCSLAQYREAMSDHNSAVTAATVSTASFIAGGALVAGGLVLFLTAPSGREAPESATQIVTALRLVPGIGPGSGSLLLKGGF